MMHGAAVAVVAAVAIVGNTRFDAPPRFDGAGYAMLAKGLMAGHGYRDVGHPDAPRHGHYPPGYAATLAALWTVTGPSSAAAHGFSVACSVAATLAAWWWFRLQFPPREALVLGLALGWNWAWARAGGSILTEPLYVLLGQVALLVAAWAGRRGGARPGIFVGAILGACVLTRHVGVGLALAVGLDLMLRGRASTAIAAAVVAAALVLPWAAWLVSVGHGTQVGSLVEGGWGGRVAGNALFYARRIPDQLTGPFVEAATVFGRSRPASALATAWGVLASAMVGWGWLLGLRTPRRRLSSLVAVLSLAVLLAWPFTEAGRFLIPLIPVLLIGAVEGLSRLAAGAGLRRPRAWALGAVMAASLPFGAYRLAAGRAAEQERAHSAFDAACAWIVRRGEVPGPVLTRQPAEVSWLTGRRALAPPGDDLESIDRAVERYGVAYILVEDGRYARAPSSPLGRYVASRPDRVERAWAGASGEPIAVYAVRRRPGLHEEPSGSKPRSSATPEGKSPP